MVFDVQDKNLQYHSNYPCRSYWNFQLGNVKFLFGMVNGVIVFNSTGEDVGESQSLCCQRNPWLIGGGLLSKESEIHYLPSVNFITQISKSIALFYCAVM